MKAHIYFELEFILLVVFSILLPSGIYGFLMLGRSLSRVTVFALAVILLALSGVDLYLLQTLAAQVKSTASLIDDRIFANEISVALYLLPAAFAGIAVNLISHLLIDHLKEAELRYDRRRLRSNRQRD